MKLHWKQNTQIFCDENVFESVSKIAILSAHNV